MAVLTNTMMQGTAAISDGEDAYQIEKSLRFNSADTPDMSHRQSAGNARTFTLSVWTKRNKITPGTYQLIFGAGAGNSGADGLFWNNDQLYSCFGDDDGSTTAVFRDPSAWYHIVAAVDTTQSIATERVKLYVNGVQYSHTNITTTQYDDTRFNLAANTVGFGRRPLASSSPFYYDGQIADAQLIDGLALSPAAFGEFSSDGSGVWNPKEFALPAPNTNVTWSSSLTSETGSFDAGNPATGLFNGILAQGSAGQGSDPSAQGKWLKFTPSGGIEFKQGIRVQHWPGSSSPYTKIRYTVKLTDGRDFIVENQQDSNDWITLYEGSGTIEYIESKAYAGFYNNWGAIEVDGVMLVDGKTDPTERNNQNDGTVWSDGTKTGTVHSSGDDQTEAFNADLSDSWLAGTNSTSTLTLPHKIKINTLLEISTQKDSGADNYGVKPTLENAGQITNVDPPVTGSTRWVTYWESSGSPDYLTALQCHSNSSSKRTNIRAIRVDGHIIYDGVADNSFHLKFNDTSRNSALGIDSLNGKIADATGGLPIYNTTDDYGEVKGSGYRADSSAGTTDGAGLVLALPGDVLTDEHDHVNTGSSANTITNNGTVVVSTDESRLYGSSLKFSGSNRLSAASNTDFVLGGGNWCIEFWMRPDDVSGTEILIENDTGTGGISIQKNGDDIEVQMGSLFDPGTTLVANQWQHVAVTRSGSTTTLFINGISQGTSSVDAGSSQAGFEIGQRSNGSNGYSGYLQDIRVYKGQAKYTANFKPPSRNDFTVNNLTEADSSNPHNIDSLVDTPTSYGTDTGAGGEVRGNYCTLNPLAKHSNITLSQGNLYMSTSGTGRIHGTMGVSSGKWYYEFTWGSAANHSALGWALTSNVYDTTDYLGKDSSSWIYYGYDGKKAHADSFQAYGNGYLTVGHVVGVAFDADTRTLWFSVNGTWQNSATATEIANGTTTNAAYTGMGSEGDIFVPAQGEQNCKGTFNFGQRPFKYAAPSGFKCLCTQNLDDTFTETDLNNPSKFFDARTYTGTGSALTLPANFSTDFSIMKRRNQSSNAQTFDRVNGYSNTLATPSNGQLAAVSMISATTDTSYTLGTDGSVNEADDTYAHWMWDAGSAVASTSNSGSATNYTRWTNATAGFSIIKATISTGSGYHQKTVDHGLGVPPDLILGKGLDANEDWLVYHSSIGTSGVLNLNDDGVVDTSTSWKYTNTSNSQFTFDSYGAAQNMIYYTWAGIPGYSSFGNYEGNGAADGTFVYCGFQPKFILLKNIDSTDNWHIYDTSRNPGNIANYYLFLNNNNGGYTNDGSNDNRKLDILSNGFKLREDDYINSAHTFVFGAFAELPFKTARAK